MKILLINPERKMTTQTPNLGFGYLATALRRNGFDVDILDGAKGYDSEKAKGKALKG